MLFWMLLLANVGAFAYIYYAENRAGSDAPIALLQISPDKLKLLKSAPPPAPRRDQGAGVQAPSALVCLEWAGFAPEDVARAEAALAKFDLGEKLSRPGVEGWWVHIPALKNRSDADKKAGEARALGVSDLKIIQDNAANRYVVSLGVFGTEEAAAAYLAQIRQKGVRSAVMGPRGGKSNAFVIRDPSTVVAARLAELQTEFPAATLRASNCADLQQASRS